MKKKITGKQSLGEVYNTIYLVPVIPAACSIGYFKVGEGHICELYKKKCLFSQTISICYHQLNFFYSFFFFLFSFLFKEASSI